MAEAVINKDGSIFTENENIEVKMFQTFFEARHIDENSEKSNQQFYEEVNVLYEEIKASDFQTNPDCKEHFQEASALYNPMTEWEIMTCHVQRDSLNGHLRVQRDTHNVANNDSN
jgi:hypothetical protein